MNRNELPTLRTLLVGSSLLVLAATALAQTAPLSRAEVKATTKSAAAQRQLQPAGEGVTPDPVTRSTKTRVQRKAETIQSAKAGELIPAGESGSLKADRASLSEKSTKTRQERKTETLAAAKARKLIPAGEGSPSRE